MKDIDQISKIRIRDDKTLVYNRKCLWFNIDELDDLEFDYDKLLYYQQKSNNSFYAQMITTIIILVSLVLFIALLFFAEIDTLNYKEKIDVIEVILYRCLLYYHVLLP